MHNYNIREPLLRQSLEEELLYLKKPKTKDWRLPWSLLVMASGMAENILRLAKQDFYFRDPSGTLHPLCVSVGDKVLLPEFGGTKLEMDGEELSIFREAEIVAKII